MTEATTTLTRAGFELAVEVRRFRVTSHYDNFTLTPISPLACSAIFNASSQKHYPSEAKS